MRRRILFSLLPFLLVPAAQAQNIKITDYSVPVSRARQFRLNFNFNRSSQEGVSRTTGFGNLHFLKFYDSLPFSWRLQADIDAIYADDEFDHSRNILASFNKYFSNESDVFLFGRVQNNSSGANLSSRVGFSRSSFTAGAGFGRFIDAGALAKSIRIDQYLNKEQFLTGHLTNDALVDLAHIIEQRGQYETNYGPTSEVRWFEAMENVLQNAGTLKGEHLDAWGILRMREVLTFERVQPRMYGWSIQAGVAGDLDHDADTEDIGLDFRLEAGLPVGLKSQFSHFSFWHEPITDNGAGRRILTSSRFTYELTNKVDVGVNYIYNRQEFNAVFSGSVTADSHRLTLNYLYYLENKFTLEIIGALTGNAFAAEGFEKEWEWGTNISASLGYRFF